MRIGLVACGAKKVDRPARARDLYLSALFKGSVAHAEKTCDRWYVLSAKHGLVPPDRLLHPYDDTLRGKPEWERRQWAIAVDADLGRLQRWSDTYVFYAGNLYRHHLEQFLLDWGARVELPLDHLRIGQQIAWLKTALAEVA